MWLICLQVRLELPAWGGGLGYEHVPMTSITLTQSARRFSISTVQGAFCFFDSYFSFFLWKWRLSANFPTNQAAKLETWSSISYFSAGCVETWKILFFKHKYDTPGMKWYSIDIYRYQNLLLNTVSWNELICQPSGVPVFTKAGPQEYPGGILWRPFGHHGGLLLELGYNFKGKLSNGVYGI